MKNIKAIVIIIISFIIAIFTTILIINRLRIRTFEQEEVVMTIAIFPGAATSNSYLIRITETGMIRIQLGTRAELMGNLPTERFFHDISSDRIKRLTDEEMQTLLGLAEELRISDYPLRRGFSDGAWEVVFYYYGNIYEMDLLVHREYVTFLALVEEIIRLGPGRLP